MSVEPSGTPAPATSQAAPITPEAAAAQVAAAQPPAPAQPVAPAPVAAPVAPAAPASTPVAPVAPPVQAQPAPVAAPPTAPAPVVQPAPAPEEPIHEPNDPEYFKGRLERARQAGLNAALKTLGVETLEEAQQRIRQSGELQTTQRTAQSQEAVIKSQATMMMAALTDEQRASVADFVPKMRQIGAQGSDEQLQLAAIQQLGPIWAKAQPQAPAAPVVTEPASTSPAPGAPDGSAPGTPPDPRQLYATARSKNPFAAAAYGAANPRVYEQTNS